MLSFEPWVPEPRTAGDVTLVEADAWYSLQFEEGVQLVAPTLALEAAFWDVVADFRIAGEDFDAPFTDQKHLEFSTYVRFLEAVERGERLSLSLVPTTTLWLVEYGRIIGSSQIRHHLTPALEHEGGHITYGIRPSDRGKGYGTLLCALTLVRAQELIGREEALVTCDTGNRASAKVIEKSGGCLENEVTSRYTGQSVSRYRIRL